MIRAAALLFGTAVTLAVFATNGAAEEDAGDVPGSIRFVASNAIATANGTFHRWRIAKLDVDPSDLTKGQVEIEIDVASVDTGIERRDDHLRTADFFEVEKWPTATARATGATPLPKGEDGVERYAARFELTIRDVTKTVDGEFRIVGHDPLRVEGSLEIDRMDFGVGEPESRWNPMSITQRVPITFEATLAP